MGYIGTKMSERAMDAHNNGEKPFSQWSKAELLACLPSAVLDNAKKLTIGELRGELLHYSSWHHTGSCYNQPNFYSISEDAIDRLTNDRIDFILKNRQKKEKKTKNKPLFVTAKIKYTEWEGNYRHYRRPVEHIAVVQYMSDAKLVKIDCWTTKRLSSVEILEKIEQKTKFADKKRLED